MAFCCRGQLLKQKNEDGVEYQETKVGVHTTVLPLPSAAPGLLGGLHSASNAAGPELGCLIHGCVDKTRYMSLKQSAYKI